MRWRPGVALSAMVVLALVTAPTPAGADPAGPTDYLTEIVAIEPATPAVKLEIVGGDSFVLLTQRQPVVIEVLGYDHEPYLRFRPDGTIERNRHSPATYLNDDRYNDETGPLPAAADADAAPDWEIVGGGGRYAWHDHRAHWMLRTPPLGLGPGDTILEGFVPLTVDSEPVVVTVTSIWMPAPSRLPVVMGVLVGLALCGLVWWRGRGGSAVIPLGGVVLLGAVAAGIAGGTQFFSLPAETEPSALPVLLPVMAGVAGLAACLTARRPATALPLAFGGAVALLVVGVIRLDGLTKPILPTNLAFGLDRFLSAASLAVAAGSVVLAAVSLSRILVLAPPAARPPAAVS